MAALPPTEYAKNGDVHLAYQVVGHGSLDLVWIESRVHQVESFWEIPELARRRGRLAAIGRLIIFDRRGTGTRAQGCCLEPTWRLFDAEV